jgi:hypothetical protein
LHPAAEAIEAKFGGMDFVSEVWPFEQTDYYKDETGEHILRQFVSMERLIDPGKLAKIKHQTNRLERRIEPSKLILATTKNYSHRIYIGKKMYAEVTLIFDKGRWRPFDYTYPDYRQQCYFDFFDKVRTRLVEQLRQVKH